MALPSTTAPDTTVDMHIPAPSDHTSTPIIHRAIIYIADLFAPAPVRAYYLVFLHSVDRWKTAYSVVVLGIALAVAEWEQPGYLPGPGEVGDMLIGYFCAAILVLVALALHEYFETKTWPWDEDGWVWPWEAVLWSRTVYYDESFAESTSEAVLVRRPEEVGKEDVTVFEIDGGTGDEHGTQVNGAVGSSPPAVQQEMVIPPTPFLPPGLRPVNRLLPSVHHSGLLGESPMPGKFKHSSASVSVRPLIDLEEDSEDAEEPGEDEGVLEVSNDYSVAQENNVQDEHTVEGLDGLPTDDHEVLEV